MLKSTVNTLIDENYSLYVDIGWYECILENALPKVDSLLGTGTYMLPSM